MKDTDLNDELLPEYDLTKLKVRRVGAGRKQIIAAPTVRLDRDVAEVFPNEEAVNEALRAFIRIARQSQTAAVESK